MQQIQLNIIPFTTPVEEAEFAFYTAKKDGYCPLDKDDLDGAIEGLVDESELHYGNGLYTDFAPAKEYLLFNNTRYEEASAPTDREHHFPVKVSFFSDKAEF